MSGIYINELIFFFSKITLSLMNMFKDCWAIYNLFAGDSWSVRVTREEEGPEGTGTWRGVGSHSMYSENPRTRR